MKIFKNVIKRIKQKIFALKYKRAVKKANKFAELVGIKYYVLYMNRNIKVVPKKTIKELIARRRFKKGTTIEMIEKRALYVTK